MLFPAYGVQWEKLVEFSPHGADQQKLKAQAQLIRGQTPFGAPVKFAVPSGVLDLGLLAT